MSAGSTICGGFPLSARPVPSPFGRLLVLGFYDGATAGIAECKAASGAYRFELVTWDDEQQVRVFALAPFSVATFDRVVEVCSTLQPPRWPVWVPLFEGEPGRAASRRVDEILGPLAIFEVLIATDALELRILASRQLEDSLRDRLKARMASHRLNRAQEWFDVLGL